jgi:serine protease Do
MAPDNANLSPDASILGMQLGDLDKEAKESLAIQQGVVVEKVLHNPAQKAGLEVGDVITLLDGKPVQSVNHLTQLVKGLKTKRMVPLLVKRSGAARFIALKME